MVTSATVISKVPSYEAEQAAGELATGAMAEVTPCERATPAIATRETRVAAAFIVKMNLLENEEEKGGVCEEREAC